MVFSPERLDYVAGAIIDKSAPFFQERPTPELHHGIVLALDAFPDVTAEERADYARLVAEAQDRLAPERRARVRAHITTATSALPEAEVEQEITTRLDRAEHGELEPGHLLYFDNGKTLTAGELARWRGGDWRIVSWAHGVKRVYHLTLPEPEAPLTDDGDMDDLLSRVGDAEDIDGLAAGARQDDDTRKPVVRYRATPHGLVWEKPTKDGPTDVLLTNFTAIITTEITEDDGAGIQLRFALTAQHKGKTHSLEIPAAQFAGMSWVTAHLDATAIVMPGMTLKDQARAAIQLLSPQVEHRRVYTHLRWRKIGEDWCYLHAGGAIGGQGAVPDVTVCAGEALALYHLPSPPEGETARAAIRASLRVPDVAPDAVTIPSAVPQHMLCKRGFFWERRAPARPPRPRWSVAVPGEHTRTPVEMH